MNKRGLLEISPEQQREEKRRNVSPTATSKITMTQPDSITTENLVQILRDNNKELCKELPSKADFQELHAEIMGLKQENDRISARVLELERKNNLLEDQFEKLLQKGTESNVVVHMPAAGNADMTEKAKSICAGLLASADVSDIDYARSITTKDSRSAIIVVKMKNRSTAWTVLKNAKDLKGSQIYIHKDLPYKMRCRRSNLVPIHRFLRANFPQVKAMLKDDKLTISNKIFTWDLEQGLKCGTLDPMEALKTICGSNYTIFNNLETFMNEVHQVNKSVRNVNDYVRPKTSKANVPEVSNVSSRQNAETAAVRPLGESTSMRARE